MPATMATTMARPPFHDQKTGIRYDCNNPDHLGWLRKESAWLKDWRPRFFVLKGSNLFFAKVTRSAQGGNLRSRRRSPGDLVQFHSSIASTCHSGIYLMSFTNERLNQRQTSPLAPREKWSCRWCCTAVHECTLL